MDGKFKNNVRVSEYYKKDAAELAKLDINVNNAIKVTPGFVGQSIQPKSADSSCLASEPFVDVADDFTTGPEFEKDDRIKCLFNPQTCKFGLSAAVWVKFAPGEISQDAAKIFLGTDKEGYRIWHEGRVLRAALWTKSLYWDVSYDLADYLRDYDRPMDDRWINVAFRWSKWQGMELLVDGYRKSLDGLHIGGTGHTRDVANKPTMLFIGCEKEGSTYTKVTDSELDEVVIFARRVRDGELVILTGGYLYRAEELIPKTTTLDPSSQTKTPPLYDYAENTDLLAKPDADLADNECYKIATKHWMLDVKSVEPLTTGGAIMQTTGINGRQSAVKFSDALSFVKLGTFAGECLGSWSQCMIRGLAVSGWFYFRQSINAVKDTEYVLMQGDFSGTEGWLFTYMNDQVSVKISRGEGKQFGIPASLTPRRSWLNLAFSWYLDPESSEEVIHVYVNGAKVTTEDKAFVAEPVDASRSQGDVTVGSRGKSLVGLVACNIAYFDRFIFPIESYKLMGFTADELNNYAKFTGYWTANEFVDRAELSQRIYKLVEKQNPSFIKGHDEMRGSAVEIEKSKEGWMLLGTTRRSDDAITQDVGKMTGDLVGFTDPSLCNHGITLTMWLKIQSYESTSPCYILSTGEQDYESRGLSIYLYNQRFYLGVVDNQRIWKVTLSKDKVPEGVWIHLAMSWSRDHGLWLAVNGEVMSVNSAGAEDERQTDRLTRATLGRDNREALFLGLSMYAFESLTYKDEYIDTSRFRKELGLIDNAIYAQADYYWDPARMIGSSLKSLLNAKSVGADHWPGPGNTASSPVAHRIQVNDKWVSVVNGTWDYVNLGVFEEDDCVCNPAKCEQGITVAVWVRIRMEKLTSDVDLIRCKPDNGAVGYHTGFQLQVTPSKTIKAEVRTDAKIWEAEAANTEEQPAISKIDEWFNAAFTWSASEGLHIYYNGKELTIMDSMKNQAKSGAAPAEGVVISNPRSDVLIAYGRGQPVVIDYHEAAIWTSFTYESAASNMMGFTSLQQTLFLNDYYWPFDGIVEDLGLSRKTPVLKGGAEWVKDAAMTGKAARTNKRRQGYVSLGDHSDSCIVDPALCKTLLVVAMNVKLTKDQDGTLFSSGAQTSGSRGVYIGQLANNSLIFSVADGTKVYWKITDDVAYEKWTQIVLTWKSGSLDLTIGGETPIVNSEGVDEETRPNKTSTATLGRHNDAQAGFINADFDEVSFKFYEKTDEPTPEADKIKRGGCFGSASQMFYLDSADESYAKQDSVATADRYANNMALKTGAAGHINLGDYAGKCLSDPGTCPDSGVTISLWIKLLDTSPTTGTILSSGPPETRGFLIKLESGRASFMVQTATQKWEVTGAEIGGVNQWINVGFTWSSGAGMVVYANGTEKGTATSPSTVDHGSDTLTELVLGKANGGLEPAHLAAVFDDVAVWMDPLPAENRDKIIMGECFDAVEEADPNAFTRAPPTTAAPTTPWVPPTDTGCDSWTADRICVGGNPTEEDLEIMGQGDYVPSTAGAIQLNDIAQKTSAEAKTSTALDAHVNILKKVSAAQPPNIVSQADFEREVKKYITTLSNIIDLANVPELKKLGNVTQPLAEPLEKFLKKWAANLPNALADNCTRLNFEVGNVIVEVAKYRVSQCVNETYHFPDPSHTETQNRLKEWVGDDPKNEVGIDSVEIPVKDLTSHAPKTKSAVADVTASFLRTLNEVEPKISGDYDSKMKDGKPVIVNSNFLSINVNPPRDKAKKFSKCSLKFHLAHKQKNSYLVLRTEKQVKSYCGFIQPEPLTRTPPEVIWSTEGCYVNDTDKHRTVCCCNHMTDFAVLMEEIVPKPVPVFDVVLSIIMYVCQGISIVCMAALFVTIAMHNDLMTERNVIHMNLAVAMTFGNIAYIFNEIAMPNVYFCRAIGIFIHFFWTVAYIWLFVESLYVFYAITSGITRGRLKCYMPLCWLPPIVLVATVAGTNISAYGWERYCWLSPVGHYIYAFIGPIMLFILITAIMLFIIICNLPTPAIKKEEILRELRRLTRDAMFLIIILCLTWIFASIVVWNTSQALLLVFTILFNLQGFFMFLVIVSGSNDIQRHLHCFPCLRKRGVGNRKASTESMVRDDNGEKTEVFYMGPMASSSNVRDGSGSPGSPGSPEGSAKSSRPGSRGASRSVTPPTGPGGTTNHPPPVCKSNPDTSWIQNKPKSQPASPEKEAPNPPPAPPIGGQTALPRGPPESGSSVDVPICRYATPFSYHRTEPYSQISSKMLPPKGSTDASGGKGHYV